MKLKSKQTYIGFWQRKAHYRESTYGDEISCGSCVNLLKRVRGMRTVYKCRLLKDTRSAATDIRLKCVCDFFGRAQYELISSKGYPVIRGKIPIEPIEMFGLRPGDGVIQIGEIPEGRSKRNPRHRVQKFDEPVIYEGVVDVDGDRWMSFEYYQAGEAFHLLYQWISKTKEHEGDIIIPMVGDHSGSIEIYRPCFKVVPVVRRQMPYSLNFNQGGDDDIRINFNQKEGE